MDASERERNLLHTNLLDAVRACQTHLVGKQRLVTGDTSWISCLCSQFEAVLQHKLKLPSRGLVSLTQLPKAEDVTFWQLVKHHLTAHEVERFSSLQNVRTDLGRGRAWVRCSLNEGSLKRYFSMVLGDVSLLKRYYDQEAFLLDEELASTLPHMAAGLTSLYFNIRYDDASLDGSVTTQPTSLPGFLNAAAATLAPKTNYQAENVSVKEATFPKTVTTRVGKKKRSKIISFGDEEESDSSTTYSQTSEDASTTSKSKRVPLHSNSSISTESQKKMHTSHKQKDQHSVYPSSSAHVEKDIYLSQQFSDVEIESSTSESHDVIMDELITRTPSGSTSGVLSPSDDHSVTLFPVQYDDHSANISTSSDVQQYIDNTSLHGNVRDEDLEQSQDEELNSYSISEMRSLLNETLQEKAETEDANKRLKTLLNLQMDQSLTLQQKMQELQTQLKEKTEQERLLRIESEKVTRSLQDDFNKCSDQQNLSPSQETFAVNENVGSSQPNSQSDMYEAQLYEQKLVEVSQMHGELLELNSNLRIRFRSAIVLLKSMKEELVALRGPMLHDALISKIENDTFNRDNPEISSTRALINVWIPSTFSQKKASGSHHVYQVFVRIGSEEWNIYRRYSQFYDLHHQIRKKHPIVDTFSFPPKKAVGNKSTKFVEERRKKLQSYLRLLLNNVIQSHERLVASPDKATFIVLLPFFDEKLK